MYRSLFESAPITQTMIFGLLFKIANLEFSPEFNIKPTKSKIKRTKMNAKSYPMTPVKNNK
jgi:hypothetical protein